MQIDGSKGSTLPTLTNIKKNYISPVRFKPYDMYRLRKNTKHKHPAATAPPVKGGYKTWISQDQPSQELWNRVTAR